MIALLLDSKNYYVGYNETVTAEELDAIGYRYVFVESIPNEILTAGPNKAVRVTSLEPLVLEFEDIPLQPDPPDPPKTPEQIRIEQLEVESAALKVEMDERDRENKNALFEIYSLLMGGG